MQVPSVEVSFILMGGLGHLTPGRTHRQVRAPGKGRRLRVLGEHRTDVGATSLRRVKEGNFNRASRKGGASWCLLFNESIMRIAMLCGGPLTGPSLTRASKFIDFKL